MMRWQIDEDCVGGMAAEAMRSAKAAPGNMVSGAALLDWTKTKGVTRQLVTSTLRYAWCTACCIGRDDKLDQT